MRKLRHTEVTHCLEEDWDPIGPTPDTVLTGGKYKIISIFCVILFMC